MYFWARSAIESRCPSVCLLVCLSIPHAVFLALRSHDQFPGLSSPASPRPKKVVFLSGCVDHPRVLFWIVPAWRCSRLDAWIVPMFCSGSSPHRALTTGRCSELEPNILFSFLTQCYNSHTSRESASPVCGILKCKIDVVYGELNRFGVVGVSDPIEIP